MAAAQKIVTSLLTKSTNLAKGSVAFATPRLNTFWRYARVELKPPTPAEFPAVQQGFENLLKAARTQRWKQLTVKEATVNTLIGIEIICWFFIGEVIGKGSIIGYAIPGATHYDSSF